VENVNKIAKDLSDGDAELLKRITGVSDKSNPLTDPFKSIGSFTTIGSFKDKLKTLQDVEDYNNYLAKYVVNRYLLIKYRPQDLYYINSVDNLRGTTINEERIKFLQSEFSGCATVL